MEYMENYVSDINWRELYKILIILQYKLQIWLQQQNELLTLINNRNTIELEINNIHDFSYDYILVEKLKQEYNELTSQLEFELRTNKTMLANLITYLPEGYKIIFVVEPEIGNLLYLYYRNINIEIHIQTKTSNSVSILST